jgi:hypothetical protein
VALFSRHAILHEGAAEVLALWTLHTYLIDAARVTPRLALTSPDKRCGKTTLVGILQAVVFRAMPASNISPAAVFRTIERYQPTLLIDEADTFLRENDELRGVLNSGHTRDAAFVVRVAGENHDPCQFSTWAPVAIALIGALPSTLADRSIGIPMRRKLPRERVERLPLDLKARCADVRRRCMRWAEDHLERLKGMEPHQVQKIRGRPTRDGYDCPWLPRLHTCGLLARAFRPADHVCVLRRSLRQRARRLTSAGQHIPPMPQALTQMPSKRQHVVSALTGVTGRAIIRALLAGARAPVTLARLRAYRCQHREATIAKALYGQWREEPRFALAQAVAVSEGSHQTMRACARQIDAHLSTFAEHSPDQAPPSPPKRKPQRKRHQPTFDGRSSLHRGLRAP